MILIGQYDSPFVRRVGIALTLYGLPFRHEPWSAFNDAEKFKRHSPVTRVPLLVLDTGEALIESHAILDYLDSLAPVDQAMFPAAEPARHKALKVATLATAMGERAVSLFYERRLHKEVSDLWVSRCRAQISDCLAALEADRAARPGDYWFGPRIGHADIAVAVVLRFISEVPPGLADMALCPALRAHAARLEALPAFQKIAQPFHAPVV